MGYAKLAYSNSSSKTPCGEVAATTNSEAAIAWREFPEGQKASGCGQLGTIKQTSVSLCQASCAIEPNCNTINFRASAERCELANCAKPQSPTLIDAAGYETYSFGTVTTAPIVGWVIGKWGPCEEGGTNVSWGNSTCDISQKREVVCMESNGTVMPDLYCIRKEQKPEFHKTCWGHCNVTRTCEELGWSSMQAYNTFPKRGCGSGTGLGGNYWSPAHEGWETTSWTFPAGTSMPDRGCVGMGTYDEAVTTCLNAGARLCTYAMRDSNCRRAKYGTPVVMNASTSCLNIVVGPCARQAAGDERRADAHGHL